MVQFTKDELEDLPDELTRLGSLGWEAIQFTSVDRTLIGANLVTVLLKRPTQGFEALDGPAQWATDPSGRFAQRFWDGIRWTEFATDSHGGRVIDLPVRAS